MSEASARQAFFRESRWMIIATVANGFFMAAVHSIVYRMDPAEYGVFFTLLRVFLLLGFPAGGLQIVFARQAAAAVSDSQLSQLAAAARAVLRGTFFIWLAMIALALFWQGPLLRLLKISNPAALWFTMLLGLISLWLPIGRGLLQGAQRFLGLGWVMIIDGVGRFLAIAVVVMIGGQAAGGMGGAFAGQAASLLLAAWITRDLWRRGGASFEWRPWLRSVAPLTFGVGVVLFMTTMDVVFVQSVFPAEASASPPYYAPAAMIGLALVTFTTPITAVMFPKIVQSAASSASSNALRQALAATALLGGAAALACTLLPELPLRIIYFRRSEYWQSAPLVPWFAWALLPIIMANVLIGNLLARERFSVVPWLVAVAVGYASALLLLRDHLLGLERLAAYKTIIQTLGLFGLALLAVSCWFTFRKPAPKG